MSIAHPKILFAILNKNFHVCECSPSLNSFLGSNLTNGNNQELLNFITHQDLKSSIRKNLEIGLSWFGEIPFLANNGQILWADVTFIVDKNNVVFSAIEITEQKKVQLSIQENLRFQDTLMREAPIGILISSLRGQCEYVNNKWIENTGLSLIQAIGGGWFNAVHPEDKDRVHSHWEKALVGSQESLEYRYLRPDGKIRVALAHCRLIEEKQVLRIEEDLTIQREQQKLVEEQNRKIFENSNLVALGTISAGIAHEINNPLAIAMGFMDVLQDLNDLTSDRGQYLIAGINKSLRRISQIVISTKELSRKPADDEIQDIDFSHLRSEVLHFYFTKFEKVGVTLNWNEKSLPKALGRYNELLQVIMNVMSNAFQAVENAKIKIISVSCSVNERTIELRIQDSGAGVPVDLSHRIFDPFFTTKAPGSGTV